MHWPTSTSPFGADAGGKALTRQGWRKISEIPIGTELAHPTGRPSRLLAATPLGDRDMVTITLADRTSIRLDANQPVEVMMGAGRAARPYRFDGYYLQDALVRGRPLRLPRHSAYEYGTSQGLPLDGFLLGCLLGDGYLRTHMIQWCNQQADMHALVSQALPPDTALTPLRVGMAGTGSASIISTSGRQNAVLDALRELDLAGCRAWEKHIPAQYLNSAREDRLALLTGLMETDGSIDSQGRMEFGTSSEQLARDVLELIRGLGGRATLARRDNIMFTSPRQTTPKPGRPCHRLTNIRVPVDITPFRRPDRAQRMRPERGTRHWRIVDVSYAGAAEATAVTVSAEDGIWIGDGCFPLLGSPLSSPLSGAQPEAAA